MTNQPFFTKDRDAYIPTPIASGPWDPKSLHGRVIIGLLAFAIEERHGADDFVPARLTVDMFRLPDLSPIEVKTKLIRDGLRIKVVEADFFSRGVAMARASCQLLRKTQNPPGRVWSPPNWGVRRLRTWRSRKIRGSACTANGPPARSWARWARSDRGGCG